MRYIVAEPVARPGVDFGYKFPDETYELIDQQAAHPNRAVRCRGTKESLKQLALVLNSASAK